MTPEKKKAGGEFGFSSWGRNNHVQEYVLPFVRDVADGLHEAGLADLGKSGLRLSVPNELLGGGTRTSPTAVIDPWTVFVGVSLFLGATVGDWALGKMLDEIYEAKIRPALKKLLTRTRAQKDGPGLVFTIGTWFDVDEVYVEVVVETGPEDEDIDGYDDLVKQAWLQARDWVQSHGVTHRYMQYRIRQGKVSSVPKLSETPFPSRG